MTKRELRRTGRLGLIKLLLEIQKENDLLREQLDDAHRRLASREIRLSHAGSIAEAALGLNRVFETAQAAADQYLEAVKSHSQGNYL